MAGGIIEFQKSRVMNVAGDSSKYERAYRVKNTTDDVEALTLLLATAPASVTLNGVALAKVEYEIADLDHQLFEAKATYTKKSKKENGQSTYSFETLAQTQNVKFSLATVQAVGAGGNVTDYRGAINFDGETVQGTDIYFPIYQFNESHPIPAASVTAAYKLALFRATGKVNQSGFKGFAAGEVLFLGASGTQKGDDYWDIDFRFAASENVTGLSIGGFLNGINKKGWEFLWCRFDGDQAGAKYVKRPTAAYVEQVYRPHDFSNIGIGT